MISKENGGLTQYITLDNGLRVWIEKEELGYVSLNVAGKDFSQVVAIVHTDGTMSPLRNALIPINNTI